MASDKMRRQIKPHKMYAYTNLVSHALTMSESTENEKSHAYHEAIIGRESTKWIITMNEKLRYL